MKKMRLSLMVTVALLASSAVVLAQAAPAAAPPPAPVVGPDMAEPPPIPAVVGWSHFMSRDLMVEMATTALDACRKRGAKNVVVVMDATGLEHFFLADDGAKMNLYEAARKKTRMAVVTLRATAETAQIPDFQQLLRDVWGDTVTNVSGAQPVFAGEGDKREVVAIIGMGGRTGAEENWCLFQGIKKVQSRLK